MPNNQTIYCIIYTLSWDEKCLQPKTAQLIKRTNLSRLGTCRRFYRFFSEVEVKTISYRNSYKKFLVSEIWQEVLLLQNLFCNIKQCYYFYHNNWHTTLEHYCRINWRYYHRTILLLCLLQITHKKCL